MDRPRRQYAALAASALRNDRLFAHSGPDSRRRDRGDPRLLRRQARRDRRAACGDGRRIPCGETISYRELARRIDRPAAVRAVGLANGSNPISVVVPCHRVIGSDGSLTGYGGGIERKRWLLAHERRAELPLTA
jgi:methylated-DNA-[protein]-cysteine S-methyltransferase